VSESLVIADTNQYKLIVTILESLGFADLANAMRSGGESVSDTFAFADLTYPGFNETVQSILSVVDVSSVVASFIHAVQEALGLADTSGAINRMGVSVNDPLVLAETLTSKGTLYSAVYDTLAMNVTVELNADVYECYVLNTPKFMPSMYSGFDFNSYCVFENRAFGANSAGIYELTGTTDAGSTIHTGAIMSETDFESRNQKKFRWGYLGISGTSPVMVLETEDGGRQAYTIDTEGKTAFSHEQKSKKWKLSVADFDTLDFIKLIPVVLSK
jgi:hypothetical protein